MSRAHAADTDVVIGRWKDGRIGIMRGNRKGPQSYGAVAYGSKAILSFGAPRADASKEPASASAYPMLLRAVLDFFRSGTPPVPHDETLEIMAFMEAADLSKARNGAPVALREVLAAPVPHERSRSNHEASR